jgi:hypothetical protein
VAKKESSLYLTAKEIIECCSGTMCKEAVQFCSLPHWFDKNFISVVIGDKNNSVLRKEVLSLPFMNEGPESTYFYHDNIRSRLIKEIYTTRYNDFISWNKRAISYFAWMINATEHWQSLLQQDGLTIEPALLKSNPVLAFERQRYELEIIYHLIAIDNNKWMPLMYGLFMMAYWYNDTKLCNTIYQMSSEYEFIMTPFNCVINQYYLAALLYSSNKSENSLKSLLKIGEEINSFPDTQLKHQVAEDIREVIKGKS